MVLGILFLTSDLAIIKLQIKYCGSKYIFQLIFFI